MRYLRTCMVYFRPSRLWEMTLAAFVQWIVNALINRVVGKFFQRPLRVAEEKAQDLAETLALA